MSADKGPMGRLFDRYFSVTLRLSAGWLLLIVLLAIAALMFLGWFAFALLLLVALAIAITGRYLRDSDEPTRHSVEAAAALLSSLALLAAGNWYFIERPRVPKLVLDPEISAWPTGDGMVLVRVSLGLENVGGTEIALSEKDPIEIEIGQVLPAGGKQFRALAADFGNRRKQGMRSFKAIRTDKWPLRAGLIDSMNIVIEAEETERLHYKAIVACESGLLLAVTAKVPKRLNWFDKLFTENRHENLYWVGQGLPAVPIADCKTGEIK